MQIYLNCVINLQKFYEYYIEGGFKLKKCFFKRLYIYMFKSFNIYLFVKMFLISLKLHLTKVI